MARAPSPPSPLTSPSCRPCSTPSPPSTTPAGRTAPCRTGPPRPTAYAARPKAAPGDRGADTHDRVRTDRVDARRQAHPAHARQAPPHRHRPDPRPEPTSCMLVQDLHIRVINAATGELLRELTLDPTRDYQPTGRPPGPPNTENTPNPDEGSECPRCLETSHGAGEGNRTLMTSLEGWGSTIELRPRAALARSVRAPASTSSWVAYRLTAAAMVTGWADATPGTRWTGRLRSA